MKYNDIFLTFTAGYMCLCVVCSLVVVLGLSVRLSSYLPYVYAVVVVTVLRVLLFVLDVCMLRECESARVTEILVLGTGEVWLR